MEINFNEQLNEYNEFDEKRFKNSFVSIQDLEKIYPNGVKAVYDFNLDIKHNEFIVIVGPSGCGKTTTLRMIAGLEDISSGGVFVDEELINYKPSKDRKMAMVFQSYALYPQMNVFDNIAFPLKINKFPKVKVDEILKYNNEILELFKNSEINKIIQVLQEIQNKKRLKLSQTEHLMMRLKISEGASNVLLEMNIKDFSNFNNEVEAFKNKLSNEILNEKKYLENNNLKVNEQYEFIENGEKVIVYDKLTKNEIKQKVFEAAKILDLGPYLDRLPKELSGGQMQRVALGRAIVKNVPIFLMDEPLSNLDAKLRLSMRSEIVKLHNKIKATTIYVTHDQTEAMTMADRIVVMSKGFIQQIGSPEEVYNHPKNLFVAKFIGSPSINVIEAEYDNGNIFATNEINFKLNEKFISKHNEFYDNKIKIFEEKLENFNTESIEFIRKILSCVINETNVMNFPTKKHKHFRRIRNLINRNKSVEVGIEEKIEANRLLESLKDARNNAHKVYLGIRPENVKVEKFNQNKEYNNAIIVKPTVCELLGADYLIHFDYEGNDFVLKTDPKCDIKTSDLIVINFSYEDMFIFDSITGDIIYE